MKISASAEIHRTFSLFHFTFSFSKKGSSMKKAVAVGIGLFICLIGLSNAGIAASDTGTIIGFNNFNLEHI